MKSALLLLVASCITISLRAQQDIQYTQYLFNNLLINPAYAGAKEDLYIQSFYRSQWAGVKGAPRSFSVAADGSFNEGRVGLGLIVSNDQLGAQSNLSAYANYAYRLRIDDSEDATLSFGLAAGVIQVGINGDKLQAADPGDGAVPIGSVNRLYPDARIGIYYADEKYFAGISATNIVARYIAGKLNSDLLTPVPRPHAYITAGALYNLNDNLKFKPVILFKDDFRGPANLDVNGFLLISEKIWLGAFYRTSFNLFDRNLDKGLPSNNALGIIAEMFATPDLRIGYSYDYSLNKLMGYNNGSHEISVGLYINRNNTRKQKIRRSYIF